jgi:hypothetical protein
MIGTGVLFMGSLLCSIGTLALSHYLLTLGVEL